MSMEPLLRWAASQMDPGARVVAVPGPRAGAGPWRLRLDRSGTLLEAAAEHVKQVPPPQAETVLVHGDLWQGNTLWAEERWVGIVDWDAAGVGNPGIDQGTLRLDAACPPPPRSWKAGARRPQAPTRWPTGTWWQR